mmetsp:Transcript_54923/g.163533  ORF Transcript_54923/g.163533 Transcript_54923/m.163533 type:complete len:362 (-) Transcript_54923:548-1633(-)
MPFTRSSLAMDSAPWKSLTRRASAQRSSCLSTSRWSPGLRLSAASEPHCVCVGGATATSAWRTVTFSLRSLSEGLTLSGSIPLERKSARMASAAVKSFSRFATTHRSSCASVSGSYSFVLTLLIREWDAWSCGTCDTCPRSPDWSTACPRSADWSTPSSADTGWFKADAEGKPPLCSAAKCAAAASCDCCCRVSRSEGRTRSGSMPCALSSALMASAEAKSLSRLACTQRSSCASVYASWTFAAFLERDGTSRSGGRSESGSRPAARSSARRASAVPKSFSRFASTHRSSFASVAGSSCAFGWRSRSGGRTKSGSMPKARSSERMESARAQSLSRLACTQRSSFASVSTSNLAPGRFEEVA